MANKLASELTSHDRQTLVRAVGAAFDSLGKLDWAPYWRNLSDLGRHVLLKHAPRDVLDCALDLWARAPQRMGGRMMRALSVGALDESTKREAARRIEAAQIREKQNGRGDVDASRIVEAEIA